MEDAASFTPFTATSPVQIENIDILLTSERMLRHHS
jgi:hypothetical protein